ncbi:c-type cytochrome domain-containing protein [Planctomicrobium sp. SH664]|uniref:c-type cytochrome domain-containing protein n=1 Tax=Planctomicrobium sp. SH664 TaxID=3448125 RepID=UPI003F5B48B8
MKSQGTAQVRLSLLTAGLLALAGRSASAAEEKPAEPAQPKITFAEHVQPIFRARCGSCHNANDRKGGLAVDNFPGLMEGGSSGAVIEPGDLDASYLWSLITHQDSPKMPPNSEKLPEKELAVVEKWILGGALENSGSVAAVKKQPTVTKIEVSNTRPEQVAFPAHYLGDPVEHPSGRDSVTALACSPWAPLTAVSGYRQVALYNNETQELLGVLPFPEGQPHVIKFSRNGDLLLVGGGRGGESGRVVVFNVKNGERTIEVGDEYDAVLGADISSDHGLIALGGPKRILRVYNTATGQLHFETNKHTDWVTAVEFSPDGVLLASADRSQGLFVWETESGEQFQNFTGHKGPITDLSWRPDNNVLASASEDGTIKLWDLQTDKLLKSWDAHPGGVSSIEYTPTGEILSTGRNGLTRLWSGDGKQLREFPKLPTLAMELACNAETKQVLVGDWQGKVTIWELETAKPVGELGTNPRSLAEQLADVDRQIEQLRKAATAEKPADEAQLQKLEERKVRLLAAQAQLKSTAAAAP